jgi:hypothetical protein
MGIETVRVALEVVAEMAGEGSGCETMTEEFDDFFESAWISTISTSPIYLEDYLGILLDKLW